jgi:hypothetical protein
LLVEVEVV